MTESERKRQVRYQQYKLSGWTVTQHDNACELLKKGSKQIKLRVNSTDFEVFKQVFVNEEYKVVTDYFEDNGLSCSTIIDAGANVGFTTLYLKEAFPDASIISIEADESNFAVLTTHICLNNLSQVVGLLRAAHHTGGLSMAISSDFRGGGEWAKRSVLSEVNTCLKSVSIEEIMAYNNWLLVDLLKIDIEGAEQFLFKSRDTASFLDKTKVLALEIHDEFHLRIHIYDVLRSYGFTIFNSGETTFAFNRRFHFMPPPGE